MIPEGSQDPVKSLQVYRSTKSLECKYSRSEFYLSNTDTDSLMALVHDNTHKNSFKQTFHCEQSYQSPLLLLL